MGIIKLNKKKEEKKVNEKEEFSVIKEKKKFDNKKVVCEVEEKKNEYVSTYLLNDGTYEQVIESEASNYYDEEEKKYKSIDNELFLDGDVYKNKEGKYRFEILKPEKGNNVKISKKDSSISWEYLGKKNSRNELVLNQKLDIKNNNKKKSKVRYENIEVDSDIEYVISGNNLKENIIVKEKSKEYEYSFMLDIKDMVLKLSSDKTKIEIYKGEEKEFEIPAPYMYDSVGEVSDEVYYEVEPTSEGKYVFSVIAEASWINDNKRVLPVTIDPQIKVESDKIITWKEEMRVVNIVDGVETYEAWEEVTHPMLRVYKGGGLEYRSIITINKSLINEYVGNIYSTLLNLKLYEVYTGTMLVNGKNVSVNTSNLSIDVLSGDYAKAIDKLDIILTSNCSEDIYFDVNNNPPTFTINYIENEHINHVKKTFNLANIATSELDLVTGDLVTSIPTVLSDLALGVSIYHVYKKGVDDYNLGCNFKLNLHEKLIKNEGLYYTYIDSNGYKHIVREFNYYKDENDKKVYISDKQNIEVSIDGSLKYNLNGIYYNVYREYKSTTGLEVITKLSDYKYVEFIEQRTEEIKTIEEQIKAYEKVLKEYSIYRKRQINDRNHLFAEIYDLSNYIGDNKKFSDFFELLNMNEEYYLCTKAEGKMLLSLEIQKKPLYLSSDNSEGEEYTVIISQIDDLDRQQNDITNKSLDYVELIKDYYKEYSLLKEKLNNLYMINPISYLTNGKIFKGFNKDGDLVLIQDMYENYVVIEYERYLLNDNTYQKRIGRVYDNYNRCVVLNYSNDTHMLLSITDTKGRKTSFGYIDGYLNNITYDTGEHIVLSYYDDNITAVIEDKRCFKTTISYIYGRPVSFINESYIKTISKNELVNEFMEISKISLSYSLMDMYPVKGVTITNNLIKETYFFDNTGFNTEYRLYENNKVVKDEKYEYIPYWKGGVAQNNPRYVVTSTTKDSLYKSSFTFTTGDVVTTTLNEDNKASVVSTSNIAISDSFKQQITIYYTYDNKKLTKEVTVTNYLDNTDTIFKTITHIKNYYYNLAFDIIKTVSYVEGEELINGKIVEEVVYDNKGNIIQSFSYNTLDPTNKFYKESEYNELGQVIKELDQLGIHKKLYEYFNNTNIIKNMVLPNGSIISYGCDIDDTITSITASTTEGEENCNNQVLRCGEVVEVNSGNNNIKYKLDHKRRIISVDLNGVVDYVVNTYEETTSNGVITETKVTSTYKDGTIVIKRYDGLGKLIDSTEHGNIHLSFDEKGRVTNIGDASLYQSTTLTYDEFDNIEVYELKDMNSNNIIKETNTYDGYGNLYTKTYSGSVNTSYSFMFSSDSTNELQRIGFTRDPSNVYIIDVLKDVIGRAKGKKVTFNNDVVLEEKISYLKQGDHTTNIVQSITFVGTNDNIRYAFDNMGNITKVYENKELAVRYLYDNLNRLIREDNKVLNQTILTAYDSNGNIINKRTTGFTLKDNILVEELETSDVAYIYNGDRLLSYGNQSITYDVLGRPTSFMGKTITWAKVNQITKIDNLEFMYDSLGRRIKKGNIDFIYDSNNRLINQGNLEFIYDHTGLAGIINGITGYFYRKNAQGDIIALVDRSGNVVVKYVYDAWGNHKIFDNDGNEITSSTHIGVINPFRYRGYYYDEETQLFWVSSRYYSPELCRWISPDSIEYLDPQSINGLNLYCYCMNDPINYADPSGHAPEWLQGLAIGLAIVGTVLVIGAVTVLTCGVGTLAGTMAGAVIYGAAQGIAIGAAVGVVGGGIVGGIASDWSAEGILIGMGIGLGAGAIVGGVIGGFAGASSFTANSAYISQYGGNVKEVLSAYKGNPRLKVLNSNTTAYRTWGGTSGKFGHWISPKNYGSAARSMLSLPPGNTAVNTSQFLISKGSTVLSGKAAALFGQTGGGIQWWIGLL